MRCTSPPYASLELGSVNAISQNLKPETQDLIYGQTLNKVATPKTKLTMPFRVKKA
jgi:hypothetical protein